MSDDITEDAMEVADNPDAGRYEVHVNGELAAYVTYRRSPGRIVFIHTETLDGFTGHGVASHLVHTVLDAAREQGLQVVPRCPYVARYIAEHTEYQDLVRAN